MDSVVVMTGGSRGIGADVRLAGSAARYSLYGQTP
jgi:hypothetical protein